METIARIKDVFRDWQTGKLVISFYVDAEISEELQNLTLCERLRLRFEKYREKRSRNANNLMWDCIGEIAKDQGTDKWDVYLLMLKRYGVFTYVCIPPGAVEMTKKQWRECEEIGEIRINGRKAVQMLCYFGSSTYNTKQFSVLLNGIISEMKEMGLNTPTSGEMRRSLEQWEKVCGHTE